MSANRRAQAGRAAFKSNGNASSATRSASREDWSAARHPHGRFGRRAAATAHGSTAAWVRAIKEPRRGTRPPQANASASAEPKTYLSRGLPSGRSPACVSLNRKQSAIVRAGEGALAGRNRNPRNEPRIEVPVAIETVAVGTVVSAFGSSSAAWRCRSASPSTRPCLPLIGAGPECSDVLVGSPDAAGPQGENLTLRLRVLAAAKLLERNPSAADGYSFASASLSVAARPPLPQALSRPRLGFLTSRRCSTSRASSLLSRVCSVVVGSSCRFL